MRSITSITSPKQSQRGRNTPPSDHFLALSSSTTLDAVSLLLASHHHPHPQAVARSVGPSLRVLTGNSTCRSLRYKSLARRMDGTCVSSAVRVLNCLLFFPLTHKLLLSSHSFIHYILPSFFSELTFWF